MGLELGGGVGGLLPRNLYSSNMSTYVELDTSSNFEEIGVRRRAEISMMGGNFPCHLCTFSVHFDGFKDALLKRFSTYGTQIFGKHFLCWLSRLKDTFCLIAVGSMLLS